MRTDYVITVTEPMNKRKASRFRTRMRKMFQRDLAVWGPGRRTRWVPKGVAAVLITSGRGIADMVTQLLTDERIEFSMKVKS